MRKRLGRREYRCKLDAQFISDIATDGGQKKGRRGPDDASEDNDPHDPAAADDSAASTIGACVVIDLTHRRVQSRINLDLLLTHTYVGHRRSLARLRSVAL